MSDQLNELTFGYCPITLDIKTAKVVIEPLLDLPRIRSSMEDHSLIHNGWLYAPREESQSFDVEIRELPFSARVFGLKKTHIIRHSAALGERHLKLLIWIVSFFLGMRLSTSDAGFLDATPIRPETLVDFTVFEKECPIILEAGDAFCSAHSASHVGKLLAAAVNALFIAQNPRNLEVESFNYLYMALDTCYKLVRTLGKVTVKGRPLHPKKIELTCAALNLSVPNWAQPQSPKNSTRLADIRNDLIHEGLFNDEQFGFAVLPSNEKHLINEMIYLICRQIVAIIGLNAKGYLNLRENIRDRLPLGLL